MKEKSSHLSSARFHRSEGIFGKWNVSVVGKKQPLTVDPSLTDIQRVIFPTQHAGMNRLNNADLDWRRNSYRTGNIPVFSQIVVITLRRSSGNQLPNG